MDQVFLVTFRHIKLRREVLNISNIPALTDIKSNFAVYGKVRVLEHEKAHQYDNRDPNESNAIRSKAISLVDPIDKDKEKEDPKENQSYFRKRLFVPGQEPG